MATVQKRPLTATEKADADRLNAAWQRYKQKCQERGESATQEWLGATTGLGSQSTVGQYLRGIIPLNLKALVAICSAIGARPSDISPTLASALTDVVKPPLGRGDATSAEAIPNGAEAYNQPTSGDNFEPGPNLRARKYPEISWVQAGMFTEIGDNFDLGEVADWHYCPYDLGERGYVLRVRGVSMTAPAESRHSFPEGTLLFVNPDLEPVPGKFVIVSRARGTEATFKRLTSVEGELFLEALNPAWPHRYQRVDREHTFNGVVVFAGMPL